MWRSEPHTPVASTCTIASSGAISSGSGRSSTRTSPGAWNVTAFIAAASPLLACGAHEHLVDRNALGSAHRVEDRLRDVLRHERLADLLAELLRGLDHHRMGVVAQQLRLHH